MVTFSCILRGQLTWTCFCFMIRTFSMLLPGFAVFNRAGFHTSVVML